MDFDLLVIFPMDAIAHDIRLIIDLELRFVACCSPSFSYPRFLFPSPQHFVDCSQFKDSDKTVMINKISRNDRLRFIAPQPRA